LPRVATPPQRPLLAVGGAVLLDVLVGLLDDLAAHLARPCLRAVTATFAMPYPEALLAPFAVLALAGGKVAHPFDLLTTPTPICLIH
jgi:hypothetical protein